ASPQLLDDPIATELRRRRLRVDSGCARRAGRRGCADRGVLTLPCPLRSLKRIKGSVHRTTPRTFKHRHHLRRRRVGLPATCLRWPQTARGSRAHFKRLHRPSLAAAQRRAYDDGRPVRGSAPMQKSILVILVLTGLAADALGEEPKNGLNVDNLVPISSM